MFAGFDYGTSNCAIAHMENKQAKLIPLEDGAPFVPSPLYASDRQLIVKEVLSNLVDSKIRSQYMQDRERELRLADSMMRELNILDDETCSFVGKQAIEQYLSNPGEGWFIKSPKSFLGAAGLGANHINFIEDSVALMMQKVVQFAKQEVGESYRQVVIGRPINFQGIDGEKSNQIALSILTNAAKKAGFHEVEFFYEPLAAGMDFESQLSEDKTVLILDIGGGTTDCSMVRMGPSKLNKLDRQNDILGHMGYRIGGNDFDININFKQLMVLLGRDSVLKDGLSVPFKYFSDAARVNDVNAQTRFYDKTCAQELEFLIGRSTQPELLKRLKKLQLNHMTLRLGLSAEQIKIGLSSNQECEVPLDFLEEGLKANSTLKDFEELNRDNILKITNLLKDTVKQAELDPDIVYLTGGTSMSPAIMEAVKASTSASVAFGDHFGSVAAGLARRAEQCFR